MSRSPTDCRVLIPPTRAGGRSSAPPPEPRGAEGLPAPGAETTALPTEAEPRPAGTRTHPTLPPASSPPPDTAGTHLVYRPDSCSGRGRGTRATPRRAEPPPAVTLWLPRLAEQGTSLKTERRGPSGLAHLIGERDTGPLSCPSSSLPLPGLGRSPLSPKKRPTPSPTTPRKIQALHPAEPRKFVSGEPHPEPAHPRAKRGLSLVYLAGASGPASNRAARAPGPALPFGWGRAGCRRRSAGRGGCAERRGGGEGRGEGAASPAPLQCPQPPSHYLVRKQGAGRRGGRGFGTGVTLERIAASGASTTPESRRPGRSPGISLVGAPSTPGDGDRQRELIPAEASIRKQVARGSREQPGSSGREAAARLCLKRLRLSPAPLPRGEKG